MRANVRTAPANSAGTSPQAILRKEPDHSGTPRRRAFKAFPVADTPRAMHAAGIQISSGAGTAVAHASHEATTPTTPTPTSPQPDTAVNVEADSMVCRM